MYKINRKISISLCFLIYIWSSVFTNIARGQTSVMNNLEGSSFKYQRRPILEIYARSVVGSIGGWGSSWILLSLINTLNSSRSFGESVLFTADCCFYPVLLIGASWGSTLMLMGKPHPPITSVKDALPVMAIAGAEMAIYHFAYGRRTFRKDTGNSHQDAFLGAAILGLTLIPISQIWFIKSREKGQISGALPENPKSVGFLSWNRKGVRAGFPGLWIKTIPEASIHRFTPDKPHAYYFLSLFSFTF